MPGTLPIHGDVPITVMGISPASPSTAFTGFKMSAPATKLVVPPVNNNNIGKNKKVIEISEHGANQLERELALIKSRPAPQPPLNSNTLVANKKGIIEDASRSTEINEEEEAKSFTLYDSTSTK